MPLSPSGLPLSSPSCIPRHRHVMPLFPRYLASLRCPCSAQVRFVSWSLLHVSAVFSAAMFLSAFIWPKVVETLCPLTLLWELIRVHISCRLAYWPHQKYFQRITRQFKAFVDGRRSRGLHPCGSVFLSPPPPISEPAQRPGHRSGCKCISCRGGKKQHK